ncbi:MAG: hypothetical protein ACI4MH_01065 [Candidatus Coproplasma sp.]
MVALWITIFIVTLAIFVAAHAVILPKIFLKVRFDIDSPTGRGVKATRDADGRKILYETDLKIRKYISGYVVSEKGDGKQVVCKVNDNLKYVDYDIVCFNNSNDVSEVINVKELITDIGYTKPVEISGGAAYVLIYLNEADGKKFKNDYVRGIRNNQWFLCLLAGLPVDVLSVFCIRLCMAKLFGGLFGETFLMSLTGNVVAGCVSVLVALVNLFITMLALKRRYAKKGDKV